MTVSNGINLEGFGNTGEQSGSNTIDAGYSPANGGSFPAAKDMSAQGNAGLNQEGSYDKGIRGESKGAEFSDKM
jgi:hypothetical protein